MAIRILVAGEIYIDQILSGFSEWPQPGEEAFASSFTREAGGGASHTASGLARLGCDAVLAGAIGKDEWVRRRLSELGVKAVLREHPSAATGTTVAVSFPGERTFFTYRGANLALDAVLRDLPAADHLHLAAPCEPDLLLELCSRPWTVSIDAGWHPDWLHDRAVRKALTRVAWFLPNQPEAMHFTGEQDPARMLQKFEELGIRAAIKLGAAGSAAMQNGELIEAPSLVVNAIDTTGAGDCFNAGFLDAWLRGESMWRALRAANICGALSTRAAGGMNGFPTREEMCEWLSR